MPRHTRFQAPPSQDPLGGAKTSLAFRLNLGFFFRQLGVFLMMDLLLLGMAAFGMFLYGETPLRRCGRPGGGAGRPLRRGPALDRGLGLHHLPAGPGA